MGLACQSLLVRDDGGGLRHPFQYGGADPTSASELKQPSEELHLLHYGHATPFRPRSRISNV